MRARECSLSANLSRNHSGRVGVEGFETYFVLLPISVTLGVADFALIAVPKSNLEILRGMHIFFRNILFKICVRGIREVSIISDHHAITHFFWADH